jgi:hypothetical protein
MRPLSLALMIFLVVALGSFHACRRNQEGEGVVERAGKKIDETLEKGGENAGKVLERAGEKLQEHGEQAKDAPPEKPAPSSPPP